MALAVRPAALGPKRLPFLSLHFLSISALEITPFVLLLVAVYLLVPSTLIAVRLTRFGSSESKPFDAFGCN